MSASAESVGGSGAAASSQMFVINLAASTSPMALSHPTSNELKRFTFFVSRQREEGRERFRLHMGYFSTQEEAEALLASVRDIYPGAWAGPAPTTGTGRRGRIAPGSVVAVPPAPVAAAVAEPARPAPAPAAAPPRAAAAAAAAKPAPPAPRPAAPVQAAGLESMSNVRDVLAQLSEGAAAPAPASVTKPAPTAAAPAPRTAAAPAAAPPRQAAPAAAATPKPAPAAPRPAPAAPAAAARPPAAAPAAPAPAAATLRPPTPPAPKTTRELELSGMDALSLLESPMPRPAPPAAAAAAAAPAVPQAKAAPAMPALPPLKNPFEGLDREAEVRLVTPEDTQTLTDIKVDRDNNAPPCFAVQLAWSATPIEVGALPHLAIFDAYTLYNVEGNRQGRKWYGLRLGFFSDSNSATQVANYVRSDYKTVAVVPVAVKERDRARGGNGMPASSSNDQRKTSDLDLNREGMEGFELLADDRPPPAKPDLDDTVRVKSPAAAGSGAQVLAPRVAPKVPAAAAPAAGNAPKAAGKPAGKRVVARRRTPAPPSGKTVSAGVGGPEVLESTLEILGASTLSLDEGGREIINDSSARKPAAKKASGSSFSRLLNRLSGG